METAEAATSRDEDGAPGGVIYDGFISYSHAADGLLAPRLQTGLQRFAKPWWKRRALRIFRDEVSLSANPHLWSSITDALDQSDWFVLLLSPDAAESEWVNREIEYWLEHKDPDRIIPVITDGEFTWSGSDIDPESTAAPPALHGAFSDEPRWVDLSFARSDEHLDLKNPRFSAAVADIASAIRQVPKDELESEEVLQHRRTIRTAWGAGVVVVGLAFTSGAGIVYAADQQRAALLAAANELAVRAEREIPVDPERAMLLSIEAIGLARGAGIEPVEATQTLRNALASSRLLHRLPGGEFVAVAPNGSMLATKSGPGVGVWDTTTWELVTTFSQGGSIAAGAAFSPSGDRLAVLYGESGAPGTDIAPSGDSRTASAAPVIVYDLVSGSELRMEGDVPFAAVGVAFARGGEVIVAPFSEGSDSFAVTMGVWSATSGMLVDQLEAGWFAVNRSGDRLAIVGFEDERLRIHDLSTGEVVVDVGEGEGTSCPSYSPGGNRLAQTSPQPRLLMIRDAESGDVLLTRQIDRIACVVWLDASRLALGGDDVIRVVDADTGTIMFELAGHTSGVLNSLAPIPGTDLLATAGAQDETVLIWDASETGPTELPVWHTGLSAVESFWPSQPAGSLALTSDQKLWWLAEGGSTPVLVMDNLVSDAVSLSQDGALAAFTRLDGSSGIVSVPGGDVLYTAPPGLEVRGTNIDGTFAVLQGPLDEDGFSMDGPVVVDTRTGAEVVQILSFFSNAYQFSPDSKVVFHGCCVGSGSSVNSIFPQGIQAGIVGWGFEGEISDGGLVLAAVIEGDLDIWLLDTERLKARLSIEIARVAVIPAPTRPLVPLEIVWPALDFSPDETMLLTSADGESLQVWDIEGVLGGDEPTLITEIDLGPRPGLLEPSPAYFRPNSTRIISKLVDGQLRVFTLDTDELISIARSRLTRSLTDRECQVYLDRECPPDG